uniref:Cleavage stimulating factor 64 n=1 Tax=Noccaea caerulescens TaxID=107243 RepID=A0A1J3GQ83_NOCCA
MAGKQIGGDGGLPANLAGMTKSQLYDIMSQMKALIDQNHQQAREILIRNPLLTKALFQAQIMLGMVQPPQAIPKVEPQVAQQSHQSIPPKPNVQSHMSSLQEPAAIVQPKAPIRKHPTPQQPMPMPPPPSVSATNNAPPPHSRFSHPQRQGHLNPAVTSLSHPQSSQVQSTPPPPVPHHPTSQPSSFHHLDIPASSNQLQQQQPMHSGGGPHLAQQQSRPYHHQFAPSQTGPNAGFQHHVAPPQHHSQPMFHSGNRPPASAGLQFPQGQPHLPSQPPYQGGGQFRGDYNNNNQLGGPMTVDRGSSWMAGQSENSNMPHLPGLGPVPPPSQVGPGGGQPPRPAPISSDMEKALLQQVMSLTQEQINLLPPEQRNQVFQLQQMLRQ